MSKYNQFESTLHPDNRILTILFFFLVASSLPLSPVLSSLLYDQKAPPVENAGGKSSSITFPLLPNVAFSQTDNAGAQPWPSLPLFPNVAFAQTAESGSQPSDSFSLTVSSVDCPEPGNEEIVGDETNDDDTIVGTNEDDDINAGGGNDRMHQNIDDEYCHGKKDPEDGSEDVITHRLLFI